MFWNSTNKSASRVFAFQSCDTMENKKLLVLRDLHPLPHRPFDDAFSIHSDILALILAQLPFGKLVDCQMVSRRFQAIVRSAFTWRLFFKRRNTEVHISEKMFIDQVPESMNSVLSSPTACSYLYRSWRRAELFKELCNTAFMINLKISVDENLPYFFLLKNSFGVRKFNPWTKSLHIYMSGGLLIFPFYGEIRNLLSWARHADLKLKMQQPSQDVEYVDARLEFSLCDILIHQGLSYVCYASHDFKLKNRTVRMYLEDLCDSFQLVPKSNNKLLVSAAMTERSDKQFLSRMLCNSSWTGEAFKVEPFIDNIPTSESFWRVMEDFE